MTFEGIAGGAPRCLTLKFTDDEHGRHHGDPGIARLV
jgi:hypothetical protein